jgi:hypothetical protein
MIFVGALISLTAVAYYATPYEMVTKLLIIPTAVISVLAPAFATTLVQCPSRTALLYGPGPQVHISGLVSPHSGDRALGRRGS